MGKDSAEMRGAFREMVLLKKRSGAEVVDLEYALAVWETRAAAYEVFKRHEPEVGEIDNLLSAFENLAEAERQDLGRRIDGILNEVEAVQCQTKRTLRALRWHTFPRSVAVMEIRSRRAAHVAKRRRSARRAHVGAGSDGGDSDSDRDGEGDGHRPPRESARPELRQRGTSGSLLGACGVAPARRGRPRDSFSSACSEARASCFSSGFGPVRAVHPLRSPRLRGILAAAVATPPFSGAVPQCGRAGS